MGFLGGTGGEVNEGEVPVDIRASPLPAWHVVGLWTPHAGCLWGCWRLLEVSVGQAGPMGSLTPPPSPRPDVKKMLLGKLSKQQIARGFKALEELEAALQKQPPQATHLEDLSSSFYTIIPHNFRRARPAPINSPDLLCAKKDMLLVRCQGTRRVASLPEEGSCW